MDWTETKRLLTIILTLFQRCGFVLIHVGCIPTTNVNNIYIHYLFTIGITSIVFLAIGSALAIGEDWYGIVGQNMITDTQYGDVVTVWSYLLQSYSIVQLVTAGRIHFIGDIIVTTLYSGFIYPVVVHSAWSPFGWMKTIKDISRFPYTDISGGSVINLFGGSFAIGAMTVLGGRIININRLDHNTLAIDSQATSALGYSILITTTMGLMLQSPFITPGKKPLAQINCLIALSIGLIIATLSYFPFKKQNRWIITMIMQGGLASLITISGGISIYEPPLTLLYASTGILLFLLVTSCVRLSGLEDFCNIASINITQGIISSILVSFDNKTMKMDRRTILEILTWQGICSVAIFIFGILSSISMFSVLQWFEILRNNDEQTTHDEMGSFEREMRINRSRVTNALSRNQLHNNSKFKIRRMLAEKPHKKNNFISRGIITSSLDINENKIKN